MFRLKDIMAAMDCCEKTARRFVRRLRVPPDFPARGGAPNRWRRASYDRLIKLWGDYYRAHGTTPQLTRLKYAGKLTDKSQLELFWFTGGQPQTRGKNPVTMRPAKTGLRPSQKLPASSAGRP